VIAPPPRATLDLVTDSEQFRLARGGLVATLATAIALGGHLLGGGGPPALLGTLLAWGLSATLTSAVAGHRLSLWRLTLSVMVSQVLFHALFMIGGLGVVGAAPTGHHHLVAGGLATTPAAHADHAAHALHGGSAGSLGTAGHLLLGSATPLMAAGHLLATILTVIAIHVGERMLFRALHLTDLIDTVRGDLAGWLAPWSPRLVTAVVLRAVTAWARLLDRLRSLRHAPPAGRPLTGRYREVLPQRGPPSFATA
jgi:hypothetical protein